MLGLGLGLSIASLLLLLWPPERMTDYQIEKKAREMGMVYKQEVLVFKDDLTGGNITGETAEVPGEDNDFSGDETGD